MSTWYNQNALGQTLGNNQSNNSQMNAYSNPQFQQVQEAQNQLGMEQLQHNFNDVQNTAMQNIANRFGGINTSALNDYTTQNNYNTNQAMTDLALQDTASTGNQYNQWRQNLGTGQAQPTSYLNNIPQYGTQTPNNGGQSMVNPYDSNSTQWGSWESAQAAARINGNK